MTTWDDKMGDILIPAITTTMSGEITTKTVFEPNVIVDSGTVLGEWDLGSSSFSKALSEKTSLSFSGKGRVASVDIRHQDDAPHTLLGMAFVFKLKKP